MSTVTGLHPYRFPGKPSGSFSLATASGDVLVIESFGGHGDIRTVWPVADYRKVYRFAPQDLCVQMANLWGYVRGH